MAFPVLKVTDSAIKSHARGSIRVSYLAATLVCLVALLLPALWNGYPLLQFDTGGYLARWYEGYLVPSRSTVFALFLHFGEGLHFWPELVLQAGCTIYVIWLVLRIIGSCRSPWALIAVIVGLSFLTALPFLSAMLLTDIFAGLGVLSIHLLIFHRAELSRYERIGLLSIVAFAAATHSATLAVLIAIWFLAIPLLPLTGSRAFSNLLPAAGAIATGASMLLAANFALSGQLAWTPGGFGIAFGRMLQDGIVKRFLDEHCPDVPLKLCPYRNRLPKAADEFLWNYGIFNELGRFTGLGEEMRFVVLRSLEQYPLQQIKSALAAMRDQFGLVATGHGTHNQIWHTYGIIKRFIPDEVPAMQKARQQHGDLDFSLINRVHVPIAHYSALFLVVLLAEALARKRFHAQAQLAATVAVAIVANAFACGVLSGPHDRYGARVGWMATLSVGIAILLAIKAFNTRRSRNAALGP